MIILSTFVLYFIIIFAIAIVAWRVTASHADYVLGGRSLSSLVTALGVGASDMSSWLMMALPGAVYAVGLKATFIVYGLLIGAYINWLWVAKRLRVYTSVANDSLTVSSYFENRFAGARELRIISALIILVFFTLYIASGFVAGALLFSSVFNLNYHTALFIAVPLVVCYTSIGGFLAVNWIDVFQGTLILGALLFLPIMVLFKLGGIAPTHEILLNISPTYLDMFTGASAMVIVSNLAWGLGYFGQPHILVRFMASKNAAAIKNARRICMTWMFLSLAGAIAVGLVGRAFFIDAPLNDPEKVFLVLTDFLLNPWIGGVLFSAVLSCILSVVSAQLIVCSSIISEDFYHHLFKSSAKGHRLLWMDRMTVLTIALVAIAFAWDYNSTILLLVSHAWAGLGASFGPIVLLSVTWERMTRVGARYGMISGALTVLVWLFFKEYLQVGGIFSLYEMIPGFTVNVVVSILMSIVSKQPEPEVRALVAKAEAALGAS